MMLQVFSIAVDEVSQDFKHIRLIFVTFIQVCRLILNYLEEVMCEVLSYLKESLGSCELQI